MNPSNGHGISHLSSLCSEGLVSQPQWSTRLALFRLWNLRQELNQTAYPKNESTNLGHRPALGHQLRHPSQMESTMSKFHMKDFQHMTPIRQQKNSNNESTHLGHRPSLDHHLHHPEQNIESTASKWKKYHNTKQRRETEDFETHKSQINKSWAWTFIWPSALPSCNIRTNASKSK